MSEALSQDYSSPDPVLPVAALIPPFAIAQTTVFFGLSISFIEIIVSAIVGSGLAGDGRDVGREKALRTIDAWVGSLVLAFAVSSVGYSLVSMVSS